MSHASEHIEKFKRHMGKDKEYNAKSDEIFRRGLWNMFRGRYAKMHGKKYYEQDPYLKNIGVLLSYFTSSPKFFESPALVTQFNEPSLDKGLLIIGSFGNGKTTTMQTFNYLMNRYMFSERFKMENSQEIVVEFETLSNPEQKRNFWSKYRVPILCIDDVKKEPLAKNYGSSDVIGALLTNRYNSGLKTHLISNYAEGDKEQDLRKALNEFSRYGDHFYDRIFEMFNIVQFKGKSLRN